MIQRLTNEADKSALEHFRCCPPGDRSNEDVESHLRRTAWRCARERDQDLWIADEDDDIAGAVHVQEAAEFLWFVPALAVSVDYQGQEIGYQMMTTLLTDLEATIPEDRFGVVEWKVRVSNLTCLRLSERLNAELEALTEKTIGCAVQLQGWPDEGWA